MTTIGVLALQGNVREHLAALVALGVDARAVRRPSELEALDGIVLPGGESTTITKLARIFELLDPLRDRIRGGLPAFGTCAGMILLADRLRDGVEGQETVGGLDVTVRRNAFGRQVDSFEADLDVCLDPPCAPREAQPPPTYTPFHAVFIRAPLVEEASEDVEVIARVSERTTGPDTTGRIVAVRQGHLLATSFHPELTGDGRIHELFVTMVEQSRDRQAQASA
ncbi:pyridoxal 5'-phosphate synthase glutaminase subunit PdxT [Nocardioidaceae bacterium]|nr:pyridoxal 5'-phosphate synthase glutaminase subunit PdxT [Nocardioidaceae bacterium]